MSRLLVPAFLLAVAANAQLSRTTESIDVNVIEIDAVVLDAQGKPVTGLTRSDFELRVGGRKRPISNFFEVNRVPRAVRQPEEAALARRDYLVLFIDDLHLNQHEKKRALDALRKFVSRDVHAGTAAMPVASDGGVRILEKFTEDAGLL